MSKFLLKNCRKIIISCTILILILGGIYRSYHLSQVFPVNYDLQLNNLFGQFAIILLYLTLLIGPFYSVFTKFPFKNLMMRSRRALGVSTFLFAFVHAYIGFFNLLGGLKYVSSFSRNTFIALFFGDLTLIILLLLALTSTDWAVKKLGKWWYFLHRTVYLAGIAVLIHIPLMSQDFRGLSPKVIALLLSITFLISLHAINISNSIALKKQTQKSKV